MGEHGAAEPKPLTGAIPTPRNLLYPQRRADIHYEGKTTHIEAGMLVHFPKGLECTWAVSEPIQKYYKFGLNVDGLF